MRRAFTVVELLVVIAIVGVLMALVMPAVQFAREAARKTQCQANLKQVAMGALAHASALEHYPNAGVHWNDGRTKTSQGTPQNFRRQNWGAFYQILPYIEQQNVFENTDDLQVAAAVIKQYFCPSRRKPQALPGTQSGLPDGPRGAIDYAGSGGAGNDVFPNEGSFANQWGIIIPKDEETKRSGWNIVVNNEVITSASIVDGTGTTMMFGERNFNWRGLPTDWDENNGYINGWDWDTIRWGYEKPAPARKDASYYDKRFGGPHSGVVIIALADGSVRPLSYSVDAQTFRWLVDRNDVRRFPGQNHIPKLIP